MWKKEKPIIPFNYTSHLNNENLGFVTGLRRTVSLDTEIAQYREMKQTKELQAIEEKATKPTNCIFQSCMNVGAEIAEILNERVYIGEYLRAGAMELHKQLEYLEIVTEEAEQSTRALLIVTKKTDRLAEKEDVELKRRSAEVLSERRDLEAQISAARNQLEKLKIARAAKFETNRSDSPATTSNSPRDPNQLHFDHLNLKQHVKKHNGVYTMTANGKAWSCCYDTDEHSIGCIDDHSVNLIHSLGNMKRSTHNYIEYPLHPLVCTSSLVLTGGNQMINKFYAEAHSPKQAHRKHVRPHTATGTTTHHNTYINSNLGNHQSVASHYHTSQILQHRLTTSPKNSASHHNHHIRHNAHTQGETSHHHHRRHHHHRKHPAADTSLAAYTMTHNAVDFSPEAQVGDNMKQTQAPQWHSTNVMPFDPVKDFNDLALAALPSGGDNNKMSSGLNAKSHSTTFFNRSAVAYEPLQPTFVPQIVQKKSSLVGKMRMDPTRSAVKGNRPLSSPAGYALYAK